MKRSEMVKKISEFLICEGNYNDPTYVSNCKLDAEHILNLVEKEGMLPPEREHFIFLNDFKYSSLSRDWEPEDWKE